MVAEYLQFLANGSQNVREDGFFGVQVPAPHCHVAPGRSAHLRVEPAAAHCL